jgi:metal-responsive CopG/Arc/MetJ family transcriptional regulator
MKVAVSIPDAVFKAIDRMAKHKRVSRSELYTQALVRVLRDEGDAEITRRLNAAFDGVDTRLDADLAALPAAVLEPETW